MEKKFMLRAGAFVFSPQSYFACLLLLFLSVSTGVWAQGIQVSGVVQDAKNNPLPGVTVTVKGSGTATSTDPNGHYTITIPNTKAVLVFSNVGFLNREEVVGTRTAINASMNESASDLEGVVVIGYGGTARKRDITGSTASVSAKQIQE